MLEQYRGAVDEQARTADLMRILPKGRHSVLDIGARDGHFSRLLAVRFTEVVALDLKKPDFEFDRVVTVAGDVTKLDFADDSFDCVFCAEVLEHIRDLHAACKEIVRVARHEIIIGVPFKQDTRVGRTTCRSCGRVNPPWGHVNAFDEKRLSGLFEGLRIVSKSFVGSTNESTNWLSTVLMDVSGNPWGKYYQDEPCIRCSAKMAKAPERQIWQKGCSAIAYSINRVQALWAKPHGNWIHLVFSKHPGL
jgi:SAM-dependent methyltransferase